MNSLFQRRRFLQVSGAAVAAGLNGVTPLHAASVKPKNVAAVTTVYRKNSHADVILGKILRGWKQDGGPGPALRLVSLYVEQFPDSDMSVDLAREHGVTMYDSIASTITRGTGGIAVDGVLSIGEHGDYPYNDKGQHLYPRRRFFEQIMATFARHEQVVPVFNDKHPGPRWPDAIWMYQQAKELSVPWMAGSSLPVSFRDPDVSIPMGDRLEACLGIGYSGLDVYGFHTLEFLQCFLERRADAESGVQWVQCLPITALPRLLSQNVVREDLLEAALSRSSTDRETVLKSTSDDAAVFLIQYRDGLLAPVLMLTGMARAISVAIKPAGRPLIATRAEERSEPRYPHFAYLLKGVEQMIHTGEAAYPVERTLLTAGTLDHLLTSRMRQGRRLQTPALHISYSPVDYSYAPHIDLRKLPA